MKINMVLEQKTRDNTVRFGATKDSNKAGLFGNIDMKVPKEDYDKLSEGKEYEISFSEVTAAPATED